MDRKRLAIIGGSALGEQIRSHANETGAYDFAGYFDDFADTAQNNILGKTTEIVEKYRGGLFDCLVVGVGYKAMTFRHEIFVNHEREIPFPIIRHNSVIIDPSAEIGGGSVLLANVILDIKARLEGNCFLSLAVTVSHNSIIGASSYLSPRVTVCGNCNVGRRVFLGAGCVIRDGVSICDDAVIGAGAVVVKDITEPGIYAGIPAKKIRSATL